MYLLVQLMDTRANSLLKTHLCCRSTLGLLVFCIHIRGHQDKLWVSYRLPRLNSFGVHWNSLESSLPAQLMTGSRVGHRIYRKLLFASSGVLYLCCRSSVWRVRYACSPGIFSVHGLVERHKTSVVCGYQLGLWVTSRVARQLRNVFKARRQRN